LPCAAIFWSIGASRKGDPIDGRPTSKVNSAQILQHRIPERSPMHSTSPHQSRNLRRRHSAVAALLVLTLSYPVLADELDAYALPPGTRVRVLAPDAFKGKLIGTVTSMTGDTVTLEVPDRAAPVPVVRAKITQMEVSTGRHSRWFYALIGAGIGAAAGALYGSAQHSGYAPHDAAVDGGGFLGMGLGALIGAVIPPGEQWESVAAFHTRISVVPRIDRGVGLTVAVAF
jgi:hypothetical protein